MRAFFHFIHVFTRENGVHAIAGMRISKAKAVIVLNQTPYESVFKGSFGLSASSSLYQKERAAPLTAVPPCSSCNRYVMLQGPFQVPRQGLLPVPQLPRGRLRPERPLPYSRWRRTMRCRNHRELHRAPYA